MDSPEDVLEAVYGGTVDFGRLAGLAEVVLAAAAAGDGPAAGAVGLLADEVAAMVGAAVRRLGLEGERAGDLEIVVGGGIFEDHGFSDLVLELVRRLAPRAVLRSIDGPPVLGAALLGLDAAADGARADPGVEAALRAGLAAATPPA